MFAYINAGAIDYIVNVILPQLIYCVGNVVHVCQALTLMSEAYLKRKQV